MNLSDVIFSLSTMEGARVLKRGSLEPLDGISAANTLSWRDETMLSGMRRRRKATPNPKNGGEGR
jgi:hypothetical protein